MSGYEKAGNSEPSVAFAEDQVNNLSVLHDNHPRTVPQEERSFAFGRNPSAAYIPQSEGSRGEIARLVIWRDFPSPERLHTWDFVASAGKLLVRTFAPANPAVMSHPSSFQQLRPKSSDSFDCCLVLA